MIIKSRCKTVNCIPIYRSINLVFGTSWKTAPDNADYPADPWNSGHFRIKKDGVPEQLIEKKMVLLFIVKFDLNLWQF